MPPEPPRPLSPGDGREDGELTPPDSPERDGYQLLDGAAPEGALPVPDGMSSEVSGRSEGGGRNGVTGDRRQ